MHVFGRALGRSVPERLPVRGMPMLLLVGLFDGPHEAEVRRLPVRVRDPQPGSPAGLTGERRMPARRGEAPPGGVSRDGDGVDLDEDVGAEAGDDVDRDGGRRVGGAPHLPEGGDALVDEVLQIRGLLDAGLPTRIIKQVLPCLDVPGVLVCPSDATPEMLAVLEHERDRMTERIDLLTRNRDAIDAYVDAVRDGRPIDAPAGQPTVPQPA
jgi:hypothetical protein